MSGAWVECTTGSTTVTAYLSTWLLARRPTDEQTILIDSLRGYGYPESDVADAIRRPWYWAEELIQAITDLTGRA